MADESSPQPASGDRSEIDGLQFEKAERIQKRCQSCSAAIEDTYYHLGGVAICPQCAEQFRAAQAEPKHPWVMRGALHGLGAAVACSIGYALISWITGFEFALVAILVGWVVGKTVRRGSHGLGGRRCQIAAVLLTYAAITTSYIPGLVKALAESAKKQEAAQTVQTKPVAVSRPAAAEGAKQVTIGGVAAAIVIIIGLALISPFLMLTQGFSGIIGVLIILVGLRQAWRLTARDERLLMGPYKVEEASV